MTTSTPQMILKDVAAFHLDSPWGIELTSLKDDNIYEYVATISGLKDTIWEGGQFKVHIKFDENDRMSPPSLFFQTIPFHPNIHASTGEPCVDFLFQENWNNGFSLTFVLVSVQSLLSNPNLRHVVNMEALNMIEKTPKRYRQIAAACVKASQKLQEEDESSISDIYIKKVPNTKYVNESKPVKSAPRKVCKLSFEDYYSTWCGIATSKSKPTDTNPLLEQLQDKPDLHRTHMALRQEDIEEQIKKQVEEHTMLMYGKFSSKPTYEEEKAAKIARLQKMKKIYLPPRVSPSPALQDIVIDGSVHTNSIHGKDEPWEKEVDDLVAWTSNLDTTTIDA